MADEPGEILFARLQILAPGAFSFVLAPVRSGLDARPSADGLARWLVETGQQAGILDPQDLPADRDRLQEKLSAATGYTIVAGRGILDDAPTLLAAAVADAVVVLVRRGRTSRADLESVRIQLEAAGANLAGAILSS